MTAIISGNGLGLFSTSLMVPGGVLGSHPGLGQGQASQYINVANGNLILQSQDEQLLFRGLPVAQLRTYNSFGTVAQTGTDGWLTGFERRLELVKGEFNQAGSTMRRYTGDGAYQDFVYSAPNTYISTDGDGANDTLIVSAGVLTYTEGSTRHQEDYEAAAQQWRLRTIRAFKSDGVTPAAWNVTYDSSGRIQAVTANDGTGSGDALLFGYDQTTGYLTSIATREGGVVRGQVSYTYDAAGRLASVTTDLTPDNANDNTWGANNDGRLYRTTYTYVDASSLKIATVTQSDGSLVSYTYQSDGKLRTVTVGDTDTDPTDGEGETLTFTYGTGTTTVTDGLGRACAYAYDSAGRLISSTSPAVAGQSDVTTYAYDDVGNLLQAKTTRGADTLVLIDYRYDGNGNTVWECDAQGNAISRTYGDSNQLLSETRYTGIDPDRAGPSQPAGGMTARYVYDARGRLRFAVDATGGVTEYEYAVSGAGVGQIRALRRYNAAVYGGASDEGSLSTWAQGQLAGGTLTEYLYDAWGRLKQTTAYATVDANGAGVTDAGAEITRFVYDAQGLLRQQVVVHGASRTADGPTPAGSEVVDYAYDGMGRLLGVLKRNSATASWGTAPDGAGIATYTATNDVVTVATSYAYLDSGHKLVVTQDNGSARTEVRNAAGRVFSVIESGPVNGATATRTTLNYYDAAGQLRATQSADGGRSYFFYDAKSRLEAVVDSTGAVVRTTYDGADRVLQVCQYANRVTTTSWLNGNTVIKATFADIGVIADPTNDRVQSSTYDTAGRLATQTDAAGSITSYGYDAANRLLQVRRTDAVQTAATARLTRYFYDDAGRLVATLDAEGYLSETLYDAGGRPITVTRYANATESTRRSDGTLAQLRPVVSAEDQLTRCYYDARGNKVGELDAEGYLTEWTIDAAGNTRGERRYLAKLAWRADDTLISLRSRAGMQYRESRMAYNALGQLVTQTNPEGTVTRFSYDDAGRLVRTEAAQGTTEVREAYRRYNVFDEVVGEIGGEGAENAKALLGGKTLDDSSLTQTQLDQAYATYGVRHSYDAMGRRTESIDAAGNKTWYFYNAAGRTTFVVRGVADVASGPNALGEVTESRYNTFGELTDSIAYTGRITFATPGDRASVAAAIGTLAYLGASDTRRQFAYDRRGLLANLTNAEGVVTRYSYNAFGERSGETLAVGTSTAVSTEYGYDRRGLQVSRTEAVGTVMQRVTSQAFDAFGRLRTATDARGMATVFSYDRLGRQLTRSMTVQGRAETWTTAYDAFDRTVSVTDPLSRTTRYTYSTPNRTVAVTTPEGVTVTTTHNRHGQTVQAEQILPDGSKAVTTQTFDRDGQLKSASDALGQTSTNTYDARGLLVATVDASGRRVELRYDAVGRLLQRVEDPGSGKLNLTTTYTYDGQGRRLTVTDPSGRVTAQEYDREGRLVAFVLDPGALHLATRYTYDALGRQVTVTDPTGRVEQYTYDILGRRVAEQINPAGSNLTTRYAYDANDNVVRRIDSNGAVTRFYYDAADRLVYSVDALGAMTRQWFDRAGRVVARRAFVQTTDAGTLTDTNTISELDARLVWNDTDEGEYSIYDGDGRLRFTVSLGGDTQETSYDSAGRVSGTRAYEAKFSPTQALLDKMFDGTAQPSEITPTRNDSLDLRAWQVYDAAGRAHYWVDALGNVKEIFYDKAGRTVGTRAYAAAIAPDATLLDQLQAGTATLATLAGKISAIADDARDLRSFQVFDAAGRVRYTIDALGSVQETMLDGSGRTVATRAYATAVVGDATWLDKLKAGTATLDDVSAKLSADVAKDGRSYQVFDQAGRLVRVVDSQGFVRALEYDAAGRLTAEKDFDQAISASDLSALQARLSAGTATVKNISDVTPVNDSADRLVTYVYDPTGQLRYTLTRITASTVAVAEVRYDAVGRKTAQIDYAVALATTTAATTTGVSAALTAAGAGAAANQRQSRFVYDAAGRLRFTLDNLGTVVEQRYDGLGRVVQSRQYGQTVSVANATEAAVANAVSGITDIRATKTDYNVDGEVMTVTDALGKTERYGYNGLGQRIRYTDKMGAVWTYGYDAAGRQTSQTSPAVAVATVDAAGVVTITSRSIVTTIAYDALGNVTSRTENANAANAADRRSTQYVYDNRGHQVKTIFPDAGRINESTGQIDATGTATSIEVTYDARGRATVQKDVRGNFSYKVYDAFDRVAYEVDQEGFVTGYTYNGFGEQTGLRRYAARLDTSVLSGWAAGQALTLAHLQAAGVLTTGTTDRTLTTRFDARGQKVSIVQSSVAYYKADGSPSAGSPTTQFTYNVYGELVKESVLLEGAAGQADAQWAETYRYYDAAGRNDLTIDAEGYVTRTVFNSRGEATETTEYARALTAARSTTARPALPSAGDVTTGDDRITRWTYDALGRKTSETAVRRYQNAEGSAGVRDVVTSFDYDAAGHVTGVTTDAGTVVTRYDALGRTVDVREPVQNVLTGTAGTALQASTANNLATAALYQRVSPYTTMAYDAFGNAVQVRRYANGWVAGAANAVADDARDQLQTTRYDYQGRAVWTRDAENNIVIREYDAADNVTGVAYRLDGNDGRYARIKVLSTYDKVGHQVTTQTRRDHYDGSAWQPTAIDSSEAVNYNAFGDIVAKAETLADLDNAARSFLFEYDAAGRLVRSTGETGTYRRYGYNLAGAQVREESDWTDAGTARTAVTRSVVDRLGRTLAAAVPSFTADPNATATITQRLDRWGNVLQVIDARGYQTDYEYNSFNQITRERRPTALVVSETGARAWLRPTNEWFYDAFGRLAGTRDANGHLRTNEYDSTGRLVVARDALNNATRYAYDVLGNQQYTENGLGYITLKQYDRLNRVTAIGDYLPNSAGTARDRTLLQQYALNQNGDRLRVTDALGYTARYDYDSRGKLLRSQTTMGLVMQYAYNAQGKRTLERYPRVTDESVPARWYYDEGVRFYEPGRTDDGTRTDREGEVARVDENTWDYDAFGRVVDHNDLSGSRDVDYIYDALSGQLVQETRAVGTQQTASRTIGYYANGMVREVVEDSGNRFRYEYDAAGNRTLEETTFRDASGVLNHTITRTYYDSNNRIERVTQDDLTGGGQKRVFHLAYEYDAVGNRRHVMALSGYGSGVQEANPPPSYSTGSLSNRNLKHGVPVDFPLPADAFGDADGERLIYGARIQIGTTWTDLSTIGLAIDPDTGRISGIPRNLTQTTFNVQITATDLIGQSAMGTFAFNVVNTPPTAAPIPAQSAGRNQAFELQAAAYFSDVNGSPLTFTAVGLPPGLTLERTTGLISGQVESSTALGPVTVAITANDGWGGAVTGNFTLTVVNSAPVPPVIQNQTATAGSAWSYLIPEFTDPNGDPLSYDVSGMPAWMSFDKATRTLRGTPKPNGSWTITVTAKDPANAATARSFLITTPNIAPVVAASIPAQSAGRNVAWSYTIPAGTFSDANGDSLSYVEGPLPAGITFNRATRTFSGTIATLGSYSLSVTASDGFGGSRSTSFVLNVFNDPPRYNGALADRLVNDGQGVSWVLPSGTFTDTNGDALTYALLVERPGYWTVDHSNPYEPRDIWHPEQWIAASNAGLAIDPSTGVIAGAASYFYAGTDPVTSFRVMVTATDQTSASASGTFTMTVNRAPNGYASTVNVDANAIFSRQITGFVDPDGNSLTYWADALPVGVSLSSTGVLSGSVQAPGDYAIQVHARDAGGLTTTATVTLRVKNTPPALIAAIPDQSAIAGVAWSYQVPAGTFTDANGDPLRYAADQVVQVRVYEPETRARYWEDQNQPLPSWLTFDAATRTFRGTPPAATTLRIEVYALDPSNAAAVDEFTLTIAAAPNGAPVPPALGAQAAIRNVAWSYTVPAFSDPNGDALSYRAGPLPAGIYFDPATRTFSGTPSTQGNYTLTITADDSRGGVTSADFALSVTNRAPIPPQVPTLTASVGTAWNYTLPAFTDANNDALAYSLTGLPPGLSFNASTRVISGVPATSGSFVLAYTADDRMGGTASTTFVISVGAQANRGPVLNAPLWDQYADSGLPFSYTFAANTFVDPDGNPLDYKATLTGGAALPTWLKFDAANRRFYGTPIGPTDQNWSIRVTAGDGSGLTVSDDFYLYKTGTGGGKIPRVIAQAPMDEALVAGDTATAGGATSDAMPAARDSTATAELRAGEFPDPEEPGGPGTTPPSPKPYKVTEHWYTYDAENHLKINNGLLVGGQIVVDAADLESAELMYDAAGREIGRFRAQSDGTYYYRTDFDLRGRKIAEYHPLKIGAEVTGIAKRYLYEGDRLVETRSYYAPGSTHIAPRNQYREPIGDPLQIGGWLSGAEVFKYDSDGRLLKQETRKRLNTNWAQFYDAMGEQSQPPEQRTDINVLDVSSTVDYTGGYDAAGRAVQYRYTGTNIKGATHTYSTTYTATDSYQEARVRGQSSDTNYKPTTNTLSYDGFGRLLSQREHTEYDVLDDRMRVYAYNGDGQVQERREGTMPNNVFRSTTDTSGMGANYMFVHAAGRQQAELREGGAARTATAGTISLNGAGLYDAGGGKVTVLDGETLASLAQRIYGTEQLWYVLADANGLSDPAAALTEGQQLAAPSVQVNGNDANTFKPYNPAEAIGPTSPGLPYITPPPKQKCQALSRVIGIVVGIVVGYFAGPAAGAAAGNLATQGSALMLNGQYDWGRALRFAANPFQGNRNDIARAVFDPAGNGAPGKIDYKSVAISAAAGYVGGVVSPAVGQWVGSTAVGVAVGAAAGYVTSVELSKAAGYDAHFSLRELGATAATAYAAALISEGLTGAAGEKVGTSGAIMRPAFSWSDVARGAVADVLTSAASYGIRKGFGLEAHWNWIAVATDAFGNASGNAAVAGISRWQASRAGGTQTYGLGDDPVITTEALPESAMGGLDEPTRSISSGLISVPGNGEAPRRNAASRASMSASERERFIANAMANGAPAFDPTAESFADYEDAYEGLGGNLAATTLATIEVIGQREAPLSWMNAYGGGSAGAPWRMTGVHDAQRFPPGLDRFGRRVPWLQGAQARQTIPSENAPGALDNAVNADRSAYYYSDKRARNPNGTFTRAPTRLTREQVLASGNKGSIKVDATKVHKFLDYRDDASVIVSEELLTLRSSLGVSSDISVARDEVKINLLTADATSQANYFRPQEFEVVGTKHTLSARSIITADAGTSLNAGKAGVSAEATVRAELVALQAQYEGKWSKSLPGGVVTFGLGIDLNAGGVGASLGAAGEVTSSRARLKVNGGATALFGGRVQPYIEIKPQTTWSNFYRKLNQYNPVNPYNVIYPWGGR